MITLFKKILFLHSLLSRKEKFFIILLLIIGLFLGLFKTRNFVLYNTVLEPAPGGIYQEIFVGDLKYPNPILASSLIDKSVAALVYSGLTYSDSQNQIQPNLAKNWEVAEDGKKYIFHLKDKVFWHDGLPFTANDVEFTIKNIRDQINQSPFQDDWQNVTIKVIDSKTIEFYLAERSAPFLAATTMGIIPAHISLRDENRQMIGTGPYKVAKTIAKEKKITELQLDYNEQWFQKKSWIKQLKFNFVDNILEAEKKLLNKEVDALSGKFYDKPSISGENLIVYEIPTEIKLIVFLNTGQAPFNDLANRQSFFNRQDFKIDHKLGLITDKNTLKNKRAKEFIDSFKSAGLKTKISSLESGLLQEKIRKREYDILVIPVEFGIDQDLYPFFHSSQRKPEGLNLANFEDKDLDRKLEEARTTIDQKKRTDLQVQIDEKLKNSALYQEVDREKFYWLIDSKIKGITAMSSVISPEWRFSKISDWYINQKRSMRK